MDSPGKKVLRCAIYTRKSTEHNLDLEFNSLDAQREACEAYIKSQAHEGWRLITDRYDDGAFSGASLERPALQQLLTQVASRRVDVIVVYKVDRLTRSLADFAKLVELFDRHTVSFVSVTQQFNTTTSMGRLTLNVLLSFAQFEREVTSERIRDKIAASKRKGIWVGGSVPLGYRSVNKKLVVVPEQADIVRMIFQRYLELGSIGKLVDDLDRKGIRTRQQLLTSGQTRGGIRFGVGAVAHLLQNRFYIGEVVYRGGTHIGEHDPILDRGLFEAVQDLVAAGRCARQLKLRGSPAILSGRIFDDRGNRMTPTHANKRGARYRYYVSHALLQKRAGEAGTLTRVPAQDIERLVLTSLRNHLEKTPERLAHATTTERELIEAAVDRVIITKQAIEIHLRSSTQDQAEHLAQEHTSRACSEALRIPWASKGPQAKGVVHSPSEGPLTQKSREDLLTAIAKARRWIEDLLEGRASSFADIAKREGRVERHIRLLTPLAFVPPAMISEIVGGSPSSALTVTELARNVPYVWTAAV
jgi:DNA invertase Pin-like site-specific DNA recombinase